MKKSLSTLALAGLFILSASAQQKLNADTEKTKLSWIGEKVLGQHDGSINLKSGWLTMAGNKITSGQFDIDMSSIKDREGNANLEKHLKSDDFFGAEKFPVATLVLNESTAFDKGTGVAKGTLTIKGVTNPVEIKATMQKKDEGTWFYANIVVDRTKYSIKYGSGSFFDNLGDKTIYDEFTVKVNVLVK